MDSGAVFNTTMPDQSTKNEGQVVLLISNLKCRVRKWMLNLPHFKVANILTLKLYI